MTRPSTDHVAFHAADHEFRCGHCGDFTGIADGSTVTASVARLQGFALMHRHCPKPVEPSRQMALPGTEPAPKQGLSTFSMSELDAIDASTSDPAPEIDPPGPYAEFERMYPVATELATLFDHLRAALTREQWDKLPSYWPWDMDTGITNAVANWARIEKAHTDAYNRAQAGEHLPGGITIPRREPMPEKLAELLRVKPKEKRGARPLTSPKRKRKGEATT